MTRRPTKAELDKAVDAVRVYGGSSLKVHIRIAEKLYAKAQKAVGKVVSVSGMSETEVWDQITTEAHRRGLITAIPGRHI